MRRGAVVCASNCCRSLLRAQDAYTFGTVSEWGVYSIHREHALVAVDDLALFAGGAGSSVKFNPKRKAEMVGVAGWLARTDARRTWRCRSHRC